MDKEGLHRLSVGYKKMPRHLNEFDSDYVCAATLVISEEVDCIYFPFFSANEFVFSYSGCVSVILIL